ncbi:TRAP transporter small permease subunit [Cohaesibacter gelatinilyticus]|uniref:TRAP transporter small permease protein n=1 Tax=Cohaesibacter gelatinilyticus TaxID=372072 RepID=A0A285PHR1_9HYPH|nr:TRAP transporter small permease subunit [Cohaesibacter gelatinilyticus]SNZ21255.1 TRAP-type mannitol/chloroaromatic compound transport system, small permease component [Cohaesibacter gelatinilyticus]
MQWVSKYLAMQDGLSEFVGRAISWLTLGMIAVLMYEIIMRYFLNSPTIWAHETSTMLYGGFCILAGTYTLRHKGHVRSEVIWGLMSERMKAAMDAITFGLALIVLTIFLKLAIDFAAESWAAKEFSNKSIWQPALYPIKTVIPIAVGLLLLQALAEFVRSILTALGVSYVDPRAGEIDEDDIVHLVEAEEKAVQEKAAFNKKKEADHG